MADTTETPAEGRDLFARDNLLLVAVLVVGVVGPGLARWSLGQAGYPGVGTLVFVLGYAGMVFLVWFGWLRPLDITGPRDQPTPGFEADGADAGAADGGEGADDGDDARPAERTER